MIRAQILRQCLRVNRAIELPSPDYTQALGRGVRGMQIGIPSPALFDGFDPDVMQAFHDALNVYRKLGAQVREVRMPPTLDVIDEVQLIARIAEAASYHEHLIATRA